MQKKSKILFITRSSENGGEATMINKIISSLSNNYEIKCISFLDRPTEAIEKHKKFLEPRYFFGKPWLSFSDIKTIYGDASKSEIVQHFIFDFHSILIFLLCWFKNKKNIVVFHTNLIGGKKIRFVFDVILKFVSANLFTILADKLVFVTKAQRNRLMKFCLFGKMLMKKSVCIPNFIFSECILERKGVLEKPKIIFVGRYSKEKGFFDLIEAAKDLPEMEFMLIGDDKLDESLENVKNLGRIKNSEIFQYYDECSIFILPSYSEVFPMTMLEAMARGLVVLISDIPGMREVIEEGRNGYLFPPGDEKVLREKILYLKDNPSEIQRISKNNLKDVKKFTETRQIPRHIEIYKEILLKK